MMNTDIICVECCIYWTDEEEKYNPVKAIHATSWKFTERILRYVVQAPKELINNGKLYSPLRDYVCGFDAKLKYLKDSIRVHNPTEPEIAKAVAPVRIAEAEVSVDVIRLWKKQQWSWNLSNRCNYCSDKDYQGGLILFRKYGLKTLSTLAILLFSAVWAYTHSDRTETTVAPKTVTVNAVEFQNLKAQVSKLTTEVKELKWQVRDLHFMTERFRIPIVDKDEGHFYYAKTSHGLWGMLPSEALSAESYYLIRSAPQLGYSKEKIEELSDKFRQMWRNPFLNPFEEKYNIVEANYHPDLKKYIEVR